MKIKIKIKSCLRLINCTIITLLALSLFFLASATETHSNELPKKIIVNKGDTLWSIAKKHYPNEYLPKTTYEIASINNLDDGTIYPGQVIVLP